VEIGDAEQPAGFFLAEPFSQPVPGLLDIRHGGEPERLVHGQRAPVGGLAQQQPHRAQALIDGGDGERAREQRPAPGFEQRLRQRFLRTTIQAKN
jgi:hypothetical protein